MIAKLRQIEPCHSYRTEWTIGYFALVHPDSSITAGWSAKRGYWAYVARMNMSHSMGRLTDFCFLSFIAIEMHSLKIIELQKMIIA